MPDQLEPIKTYSAFTARSGVGQHARALLRKAVLAALSMRKSVAATDNWIRFPYYHHVFDDEIADFRRQLMYLKKFGDFISMDQAHELLTGKDTIKGRFFCVSFDDGFRNCHSNMMPVVDELSVPVIIYLPTDYIGLEVRNSADRKKIASFYPEEPKLMEFLDWDECKEMLSGGVAFGSHTASHANLSKIPIEAIRDELVRSKSVIEDKLGVECRHFACPWGRPGLDFDPLVATGIAREANYASFATTQRGKMEHGADPYHLRREHLVAGWENAQLKYFFAA